MTKNRIVSLIASSTEAICALGFEKELVGRSHECDYPTSVLDLPICSEPNFEIEGSSLEIDQRVRYVLENALSVYKLDVDRLQSLSPSLIVTQDHCEVCAVSLKDVEKASCQIFSSNPKIITLAPDRLEDIYQGFREISIALGSKENGERLITGMKDSMEKIKSKIQSTILRFPIRKIALLEWIEPIFTSGSWMPEIIEYIGAVDVLSHRGKRSRSIPFDELSIADPDVLIIAPCGYSIPKIKIEMEPLIKHPKWNNLKSVKNSQVYIADGNQYFNRPGPRLLDSLQILSEILYPNDFNFGHYGVSWECWN